MGCNSPFLKQNKMAKYKVLVLALSCLGNKVAEGSEVIDESALPVDNIPSLIEQCFIELVDESEPKKGKGKSTDELVDESEPKKK
jgi:hypothetical protein